MAATAITASVLDFNAEVEVPTAVAVGSEGSEFVAVITPTTSPILFLHVENGAAAAKDVTIVKSNDVMFSVGEDITEELAAGGSIDFLLNVADYADFTGAKKGKITVKGESADIKVSAYAPEYKA